MRFLRDVVARYSRGHRPLTISGGYAVIVTGVAAFVIVAGSLKPGSIAAMWLIIATLPGSLVVQFIPAQGMAFVLLLALGGLVQAWLLWILLRGRRVLQRQ